MSKAIHLSRRERQIMDILYESSEATAHQVMERLPDAPGYSAVRALLKKMEDKGYINHREEALKYVYFPLVDSQEASRNAIQRLVRTFFEGSNSRAVNAMLGMSMQDLSDKELDALEESIKKARKK